MATGLEKTEANFEWIRLGGAVSYLDSSREQAFARFPGFICRSITWQFKRTWKWALALVLVVAAAHEVATFVLGRQVEAEFAKIRARGEPVFAAELAGRPLPDNINGAVIYEKAFKMIEPKNKSCTSR